MGLRTDADDGKEIEGRALFINHVSKGLKPEVSLLHMAEF